MEFSKNFLIFLEIGQLDRFPFFLFAHFTKKMEKSIEEQLLFHENAIIQSNIDIAHHLLAIFRIKFQLDPKLTMKEFNEYAFSKFHHEERSVRRMLDFASINEILRESNLQELPGVQFGELFSKFKNTEEEKKMLRNYNEEEVISIWKKFLELSEKTYSAFKSLTELHSNELKLFLGKKRIKGTCYGPDSLYVENFVQNYLKLRVL